VVTIDEDLGKSGSGLVERPGFQRLLAEGGLCRPSRGCSVHRGFAARAEWPGLASSDRVVRSCGAVVIDPEGIYDPRVPNDRLLLGLKGTMNEFELHLFRQRSFEAMRQKARRGEFQCNLPSSYCWAGAKRRNRVGSRSSSPVGDPLRFRAVRGAGECPSSSDEFRASCTSLRRLMSRRAEWAPTCFRTLVLIESCLFANIDTRRSTRLPSEAPTEVAVPRVRSVAWSYPSGTPQRVDRLR
jgi:hypothetical protein